MASSTKRPAPADPALDDGGPAPERALRAAVADLTASTRLAVAFSGGLDSSALLLAAAACMPRARLMAFHIDHGLSPHADAWRRHCAGVAASLGVAFAAESVQVRAQGQGIEAAARQARYTALEGLATAHRVPVVLLAHHAEDQAETVLLQALRGAGLAGVRAMPADTRTPAGLAYRRPWLALPRAALHDYAAGRIGWLEDESNGDPRYARNALRQALAGPLGRHFPAYGRNLARLAQHASEAQTLLDALADQDLGAADWPMAFADEAAGARIARHALGPRRETLVGLDDARLGNALRRWIVLSGLRAPSTRRLDAMRVQLRRATSNMAVPHDGHLLRLDRDRLCWRAASRAGEAMRQPEACLDSSDSDAFATNRLGPDGGQAVPQARPVSTARVPHRERAAEAQGGRCAAIADPATSWRFDGGSHVVAAWRGTLHVETATCAEAQALPRVALLGRRIEARVRRGGERLRTRPGGPARTLKNLFQEAGVPPWRRNVPLFYLDGELLFVPGLGVDGALAQRLREACAASPCLRLAWREAASPLSS